MSYGVEVEKKNTPKFQTTNWPRNLCNKSICKLETAAHLYLIQASRVSGLSQFILVEKTLQAYDDGAGREEFLCLWI